VSEQTRTPGNDLGDHKHRSAPSQPASNPGCAGADQKISVAAAPAQLGDCGGIRHLPLRGGHVALVDDDIYAQYGHLPWRVGARGHVVRSAAGRTVYMAREILILPADRRLKVVYLNGNRLDLRREHLEVGTPSDITRRRWTNPASEFYGVSYNPVTGRFAARVRHPLLKKQVTLQEFDTREKAAKCRDAFERFQGTLARLNFPAETFDPREYRAYGRLAPWSLALAHISQFALCRTSPSAFTLSATPSTVEKVKMTKARNEEQGHTMSAIQKYVLACRNGISTDTAEGSACQGVDPADLQTKRWIVELAGNPDLPSKILRLLESGKMSAVSYHDQPLTPDLAEDWRQEILAAQRWVPYALYCTTARAVLTKNEQRNVLRNSKATMFSLWRAVGLLADLHEVEVQKAQLAFGVPPLLRIRSLRDGEVITVDMLQTMAAISFPLFNKEARAALQEAYTGTRIICRQVNGRPTTPNYTTQPT